MDKIRDGDQILTKGPPVVDTPLEGPYVACKLNPFRSRPLGEESLFYLYQFEKCFLLQILNMLDENPEVWPKAYPLEPATEESYKQRQYSVNISVIYKIILFVKIHLYENLAKYWA